MAWKLDADTFWYCRCDNSIFLEAFYGSIRFILIAQAIATQQGCQCFGVKLPPWERQSSIAVMQTRVVLLMSPNWGDSAAVLRMCNTSCHTEQYYIKDRIRLEYKDQIRLDEMRLDEIR